MIDPRPSLSGLYLILDPSINPGRDLLTVLQGAAAGGVKLFQYRNKQGSMGQAYEEGLRLREAARRAQACFIVNDRCDLALALDADGVHLGQDDLSLPDARTVMGPNKLIGISTHTPDQVRAATLEGADYLGFGPIFATSSKPDHEPVVGVEGLAAIRPLTSLPIFAIGGIQPSTYRSVLSSGANGAAVMSALLTAPDIGLAIDAFTRAATSPNRPISR
ncbi:MAG: thiamine phosphate synthase [Nitrospiraceae bacterium]